MKFGPFHLLLVCLLGASPFAAARTYVPSGEPSPSLPMSRSVFTPVKTEARPFLPGLRLRELELLEDALRRKQPRTIGDSTSKAHDSILRNWLRSPAKRAHAKGIFAEALYLDRNPQWGYVSSPNASQHDLYTWIAGRKTPFTAQVKTHTSGDPATYARDMVKDYRSNLFLVPDDHVAGLKDYWRNQIKDFESRGLSEDAVQARRQMARVRGLDFTSSELDASYTKVAQRALRERQAGYVSIGAALAMTFGPDLWEWAWTGSLPSQATSRWVRAGATMGSGAAASYALTKIAKGSWQGGWKGNAVVGSALVLTDGYFEAQEYGGVGQALTNPNYYCRMSGGVGGTTLAIVVFAPVSEAATLAAIETGPFAPFIGGGVGVLASAGAYMIGSVTSEASARWLVEKISPETLHQTEIKMVAQVHDDLVEKMRAIQTAPTISFSPEISQ